MERWKDGQTGLSYITYLLVVIMPGDTHRKD